MAILRGSFAVWAALLCAVLQVSSVFALPDLAMKLGGAPSKMGDGAYPRATYLLDGSLLGVYTASNGSHSILTVTQSTDNSLTWNPVGTIAAQTSKDHDLDNAYMLQLPSGKLIAAFRNHDKNPDDNSFSYYRITVCCSEDLGKTWKFTSQAHEETDPALGVWEPFLRLTKDGNIQIYYSRENSATDQDIWLKTSTDEGATWSPQVIAIGGDMTDRRDGMPGIASPDDGTTLVCVFESLKGKAFKVQQATSTDDGNTWSNRADVYVPGEAGRSAQSPQIANTGGVLVASFMTNEDTGTQDAAVKIVSSSDGGRSWGNKMTVAEAPQFWPGLAAAPFRNFLCLYGNGPQMVQKIRIGGRWWR